MQSVSYFKHMRQKRIIFMDRFEIKRTNKAS